MFLRMKNMLKNTLKYLQSQMAISTELIKGKTYIFLNLTALAYREKKISGQRLAAGYCFNQKFKFIGYWSS